MAILTAEVQLIVEKEAEAIVHRPKSLTDLFLQYILIPIAMEHKGLLHFHISGVIYQFGVLHFVLAKTPRVFPVDPIMPGSVCSQLCVWFQLQAIQNS